MCVFVCVCVQYFYSVYVECVCVEQAHADKHLLKFSV